MPSKPSNQLVIVANPIYDVVFKVLMENLEVAREFLGAITGLNIIEVKLLSQEHARKDETGKIRTLRLDFCALVDTEDGESFQIIIELQKQALASNALRFRRYLASTYAGVSEVVVDGEVEKTTLPIISIYLLGFELAEDLPAVVEVRRQYRDLINEKELDRQSHNNSFIERLTHDAYFIQIPKISGNTSSRLESVLSIFDQRCKVKGDDHRLEFDSDKANQFLRLVFRILKRLQGDTEMEQLMLLEDTFLLEQEMLADEVRKDLKQERRLREEEQKKRKEEQKKREEEQKKRKEEQKRREAAEQKLKELQALLDEKNESDSGKN